MADERRFVRMSCDYIYDSDGSNMDNTRFIEIIVDKVTGVNYIAYSAFRGGIRPSGRVPIGMSMTPLLDQNGKVVITPLRH